MDLQPPPATCRLGPLTLPIFTRQNAIKTLLNRFNSGQQTKLGYANTNLINFAHQNPALATALRDFTLLNDGIGLSLGAYLRYGKKIFPDNLNGTDFTPDLLSRLPNGTKVFLYGSKPQIALEMAQKLVTRQNLTVVGHQDGYTALDQLTFIKTLNTCKADVVLVALGNPKQEEWIAATAPHLSAKLLIGVGALFDFATGHIPRAPTFMRRLKLEWLYRLIYEPRRLCRRYTLDILTFTNTVMQTPTK